MTLPLQVNVEKICLSPDGQRDTDFKPGDFILTFHDGFYSKLIRIGQSFRFRGKDRAYIKYTHTAMIINTEGDLIEALATGVTKSHISKYTPTEYIHVGILASDEDRNEILNFVTSCLGQQYGWLTILSIAITLLLGGKFSFNLDGTEICSGLVARALERTTAIFPENPTKIMPCQLAKYYLSSLSASA